MNCLNLIAFAFATLLSALLTRACISLAYRLRVVDRPGNRKTHAKPVAYLGGAGLFAALGISLLLSLALCRSQSLKLLVLPARLLPALTACILGLADDIYDLRARSKFLFQILIALAFSFFCYRFEIFHLPGLKPLALGWSSIPVTAFFILAVANGMNMIDGSDGLCASTAAMSLGLIAIAAASLSMPGLGATALSACGACLGFLFFNRPPAKIYLGDAGSQGLGFLIACLVVSLGQGLPGLPCFISGGKPSQPFHYHIVLALLLVGFPALEVTLSVLRRGLQGRRLFRGDQGHLHNRLRKLGLDASWIARLSAFFTFLSGSVAIAFLLQEKGIAALLVVALVGLLGLSLPMLGYTRLLQRRWLDERRPHFAVVRHFSAMQSAKLLLALNLDEALALVAQACREFGVEKCRIKLHRHKSGKPAWAWAWIADKYAEKYTGSLERLRLGPLGAAVWVLAPPSIEPELEMECRVVISEFMRQAVERVYDLYQRANPEEAEMAAKLRVMAAPSISWLKDRVG